MKKDKGSLEDLANNFLGEDFEQPADAQSFKGDLPPQAKLEHAGDQLTGYFVSTKVIQLRDQNPPYEMKDVQVYTFMGKNGNQFALLGRSALDTAMENAATKQGGWDKLRNMVIRINREEDSKLKGGRSLGNYLVTVWEERRK